MWHCGLIESVVSYHERERNHLSFMPVVWGEDGRYNAARVAHGMMAFYLIGGLVALLP